MIFLRNTTLALLLTAPTFGLAAVCPTAEQVLNSAHVTQWGPDGYYYIEFNPINEWKNFGAEGGFVSPPTVGNAKFYFARYVPQGYEKGKIDYCSYKLSYSLDGVMQKPGDVEFFSDKWVKNPGKGHWPTTNNLIKSCYGQNEVRNCSFDFI